MLFMPCPNASQKPKLPHGKGYAFSTLMRERLRDSVAHFASLHREEHAREPCWGLTRKNVAKLPAVGPRDGSVTSEYISTGETRYAQRHPHEHDPTLTYSHLDLFIRFSGQPQRRLW